MNRATSHPFLALLVFCASLSVWTLTASGQSPFSSVKMEVRLSQEEAAWKAEAKFLVEDKEFSNPIRDIKVDGDAISFTVNIEGTDVRFTGRRVDDKLD